MVLDAMTLVFLVLAIAILIALVLEYNLSAEIEVDHCEYRKNLLEKVQDLRLYKMISLLGLPIGRYIVALPVTEIQNHVEACRACTELNVCDQCLRDGVPEKDMHFCPNYVSLMKHKKKLGTAG